MISKKREVVQGKVLRRGDVSKLFVCFFVCFVHFLEGTLGGFPKFKACQYVWYDQPQPLGGVFLAATNQWRFDCRVQQTCQQSSAAVGVGMPWGSD